MSLNWCHCFTENTHATMHSAVVHWRPLCTKCWIVGIFILIIKFAISTKSLTQKYDENMTFPLLRFYWILLNFYWLLLNFYWILLNLLIVSETLRAMSDWQIFQNTLIIQKNIEITSISCWPNAALLRLQFAVLVLIDGILWDH